MDIQAETFVKNVLYVSAIRVTEENMTALAAWAKGHIGLTNDAQKRRYIMVPLHGKKKQEPAYSGDWIVKMNSTYRVYTDKAFHESFHRPGDRRPVPNYSNKTVREILDDSIQKERGELRHAPSKANRIAERVMKPEVDDDLCEKHGVSIHIHEREGIDY